MKQPKRLTRAQKIRLREFLKKNGINYEVDDFAVTEENREEFSVTLKKSIDKGLDVGFTIPY